jgi:hypothetical protein
MNNLSTLLHRSVVRSAADANHRNQRVTFTPDVQKMIEKLDVTSNNIARSSFPKQKTRKQNDDVASRAGSKTGYIERNIGDRTRSKLYTI